MPDPLGALESDETLEVVAAVEHQRWAHWQKYLHEQCVSNPDGSLTIPAELVQRWARQLGTPYALLTTEEKQSDREQAHEYIAALKSSLRSVPNP